MNIEDAERILIRWIRERPRTQYASYGYDVYIPTVLRWHLGADRNHDPHGAERRLKELSTIFYSAAWELCRRGVIRPGIREHGLQSTDDGGAGNGYSITPFGEQWAAESEHDDFVPTEPQRFGEMLKPYGSRFGGAFQERAQEAIRCYGAHAYLACCTMCGAAAESVLLAAAIAKNGEEATLREYSGARGRSRVQTSLLGHVPEPLRLEFNQLSVLLKYWRDAAAHGRPAVIAENEAYTSLALLLRFALFVEENWDRLTNTGSA